jgi:hypothetical protein
MQKDMMSSNPEAEGQAVSLDGVRYAALKQPGGLWRMGTVNPRWLECMPARSNPAPEELAALEAKGNLDGVGQLVNTGLQLLTGFLAVNDHFCHD